MDDVRDVAALLEERPDLEDPLRAVLEVDAERDSWTFDDVPIDSGSFGELVSRDLVEKTDDGDYQATDPEALRAALSIGEDQSGTETDDGEMTASTSLPSMDGLSGALSVPSMDGTSVSFPSIDEFGFDIDRRVAGVLAGTLALVFVFRILSFTAVYRGEHVVLSANDPYYYRYWVEQLLAGSTTLSELPGAVAKGEPLMVATLWWMSSLLGGSVTTAGHVLAWYPVVSAVLTGLLVYLLAVEVTEDRRIGLAAVALLAVIPAHAMRTSLGFADHHAFDYPWLVLTALSIVVLARCELDRETLLSSEVGFATAGLGIGIAGQVLAWEAGPLLVVPIALYLSGRVLLDVRDGRSPVIANLPILVGLILASSVSHLAHVSFGWHTDQVTYAPALLLIGAVGLILVAESVYRAELSAGVLGGIEAVGAVVGVVAFRELLPTYWGRLSQQVARLFGSQEIVEVQPLFGANSFGWLLLFGFILVLAIPYLVWGSRQAYRGESWWLAGSVYGWYFVVLSAIQLRFAGELAPFIALFGGFGFVHLAERVDLARLPRPFATAAKADGGDSSGLTFPNRRQSVSIVLLFLLVGGLGMIQVPIKTTQLTIDEDTYRTATWIDDYAEAEGLEGTENFVLSQWGRNRVYNYFVSGESKSYSYARAHYGPFMTSDRPDAWYEEFAGRVGFVVTTNQESDSLAANTTYRQLHEGYGARYEGQEAVGHYRAVYADVDGSHKVFRIVPGARITGPAPANSTFELTRTVDVGGDEFTYERDVTVNRHGVYEVRVPYPGGYKMGKNTLSVSESAVAGGGIRSQFDGEGMAYWSFDEGRGDRVYDRVGGYHGSITKADWARGINGTGLRFDGESSGPVRVDGIDTPDEFSVSLWVRPVELDVSGENDYRHLVSTGGGSILILEENGKLSFRLPGIDSERLVVTEPRVSTEEWTHIVVTYDGDVQEVFVDGQQVASKSPESGNVNWKNTLLVGAEEPAGDHVFDGTIDEIRVYQTAISAEKARTLSTKDGE